MKRVMGAKMPEFYVRRDTKVEITFSESKVSSRQL